MITLGVGYASACSVDELSDLARSVMAQAAVHGPVMRIATRADKRGSGTLESAGRDLGLEVLFVDWAALAAVQRETSAYSAVSERAVGLGSVAEAAALVAAGSGARLVVTKRVSRRASCAAASGPGHSEGIGL